MGLLPQQTPSTLKKDQPLYHSDNEYQLTQQHKVHQNSYPKNQKSKSHIFFCWLWFWIENLLYDFMNLVIIYYYVKKERLY